MSQRPRIMLSHVNYEADYKSRLAKKAELASKVAELEAVELGLGSFLKKTVKKVVDKVTGHEDPKPVATAPPESAHAIQQRGGSKSDFDEKKHPRGDGGKFAKAPAASTPPPKGSISKVIDKVKAATPATPATGSGSNPIVSDMTEEKPKKLCDKIDGERVCGSKWSVTLKNGTKISLYEVDQTHLSKEEKRNMLNVLAEIHNEYPGKLNTTKILLKNSISVRAEGLDPSSVAGFTTQSSTINNKANSTISFNVDHPLRNNLDKDGRYTVMPSLYATGFDKYFLLHETGHQFDVANNRTGSGSDSRWNSKATLPLFNNPDVKDSLSIYGRTDYREAYAEAFAEWHGTGGKTKNVAAIAYAKQQGWVAATTKVAAPAKKKKKKG